MKTTNNMFAPINAANMNNLVKEVKETVATNEQLLNHKTIFIAADLWNIQRMKKTRTTRRLFA